MKKDRGEMVMDERNNQLYASNIFSQNLSGGIDISAQTWSYVKSYVNWLLSLGVCLAKVSACTKPYLQN